VTQHQGLEGEKESNIPLKLVVRGAKLVEHGEKRMVALTRADEMTR
jgi:hypothetical protein